MREDLPSGSEHANPVGVEEQDAPLSDPPAPAEATLPLQGVQKLPICGQMSANEAQETIELHRI